MVKNQKQASTTKKEIDNLLKAKEELLLNIKNEPSYKINIGQQAFDSLIYDLKTELTSYENLRDGKIYTLNNLSFEKLPQILISARIAQNKSHRDLAEILKMTEQQIQRYEANDYEGAKWETLSEVALALNLNLKFNRIEIKQNETVHEFIDFAKNEIIKKVTNKLQEKKSFFV